MTYNAKVYRKQGGDELHFAADGKLICDGSVTGVGKSTFWNDCPINMGSNFDPALGLFIGDDFNWVNYATAHNYLLAGTNDTTAALAANPSIVRLATAGADKDSAFMSTNHTVGPVKLDASHDWWFEARVKVSQITLAQGVFIGLYGDAAAIGDDLIADDTGVLKVSDYIGFQIIHAVDEAAVWQTIHCLAGQHHQVVSATAGTPAVAFTKLGMKSVSGTVTFYIDGVALATTVASSAHDYPLNKYCMPCFGTKAGQATANTLDLDWWYLAQLR